MPKPMPMPIAALTICERAALAADRVANAERLPRGLMENLLPELEHSDDVYELLRHVCRTCHGALPVPLPELLDAVLAAGSRDCTFVFRHCAWPTCRR